MSEEGKKYTKEEIKQILEENARLREKIDKVSKSRGSTWAKQQERMATDPEYAEKIKAQRKATAAKQRERLKNDPVAKEKAQASAKARREKQKAELAELRAFKANKAGQE